jgi:phage terminase large subunit-like protein
MPPVGKSPGRRSTPSSIAIRTARRLIDPPTFYAEQVLGEKIIAGRLARLACTRHIDDLTTGHKRGLVWSPETAKFSSDFFRYLKHSKGEWAGQSIELEPWQEFTVGSVFGWKRKNKTRRFRMVYEEIARKNGKSTKLSGIGLYSLVADREAGAEIYAAATKKDQARIIFDEARRMVLSSEELRRKVNVYRLNLSVDLTGSKFEPLSSDDRTLDGLNPQTLLVDELHKHKSRALLDVLDTAMGSRRQPLIWIITTSGDDNPESVYAAENDYAIKVLERVVEDDNYFAYIATIDKADQWDDPKIWIKANPNLGVSVKMDDLQRQALKAKGSPPAKSAFMRLRLNVRSSGADRALDMEQWAKNSLGKFDPGHLAGRKFYGALDLSSKIDLTAWVKVFPPTGDNDPRWRIVPRFWLPADTVEEKSDRDRVQYRRWIDEGFIETTAGNTIDHNEIQAAVQEDCRIYEALSIAYDSWNAAQLANTLLAEGLPMFEFIQGVRSYNGPMKELMAMVLACKLDHGDNPVLTWMAHNLHITKPDKNQNYMPSKQHSTGRIDGMTATIMAIGRSMVAEEGVTYLNTDEIISF